MTTLSPADRARKLQLSYPAPREWLEAHPEQADEFVRLIEQANEQNYAAIERAIAEAVEGERERCANYINEVAGDQATLAKGNYSHEHHAAFMLRETAKYLSRSQS